jgi:small subunit ribosomal protein S16
MFAPFHITGVFVAVKIRLKRMGKIRAPHYRIVVADSRTKRDGRVIEEIGRYIPTENPSFIEVNSERARYWLGVGAQPTEQVEAILKLTGDFQASKGDKNAKNVVKTKEAKAEFVIDTKKKPVLLPKDEQAAAKKAAAEAPVEAVEEVAVEAAVESEAVVDEAAPAVEEAAVEAEAPAEEAPAAEAEAEAAAPAEEA